jgi:hypothetical protein
MKYFISGSYQEKLDYNLEHDMINYDRWFVEHNAKKEIAKVIKDVDTDQFINNAFETILKQ